MKDGLGDVVVVVGAADDIEADVVDDDDGRVGVRRQFDKGGDGAGASKGADEGGDEGKEGEGVGRCGGGGFRWRREGREKEKKVMTWC